jgi:hypothetical protein
MSTQNEYDLNFTHLRCSAYVAPGLIFSSIATEFETNDVVPILPAVSPGVRHRIDQADTKAPLFVRGFILGDVQEGKRREGRAIILIVDLDSLRGNQYMKPYRPVTFTAIGVVDRVGKQFFDRKLSALADSVVQPCFLAAGGDAIKQDSQ